VAFWGAIAALLGAPDPAMASTAIAAVSHTRRIVLRTVTALRNGAAQHCVSLIFTLLAAQQTYLCDGKSEKLSKTLVS
jgi:hypothetical protein